MAYQGDGTGDQGAILIGPQRDFCPTWKTQTEMTVKGTHFIQEDGPDEIGQALAERIEGLNSAS